MNQVTILAVATALALSGCSMQPSPVTLSGDEPVGASFGGSYALEPNVAAACPVPDASIVGAPQCYALYRTDADGKKPHGYGPSDFRSAYNLPSAAGKGQTIGIVDFYDDPNAESDLATYRAEFGLPPCTSKNGCFRKVNQNGKRDRFPKPNRGWGAEISLDLDMASAGCPQCRIVLVEARSSGNAGEDTAIALGADVVSNSWGSRGNASYDKAFDHPGHVITVASGDTGYSKFATVPDGFNTVVSVGGTSLRRAKNARGWTETAWSGSTSECNLNVKKPVWQRDPDCTGRTETDVSSVADPNTGVAVYDTFDLPGWVVFGGTSAASPLVAAIYALAGNEKSLAYARSLYQNAADLNDITVGKNGDCNTYICDAGPGYDGPTGNGTPNGLGAF